MAIVSAEFLTDEEVLGDYTVYDLDRSDGESALTSQFGQTDPTLTQINLGILPLLEAPTSENCSISFEPNSGIVVPLLRNAIINQIDGCNDEVQINNVTLISDKPVN